jgi:hypothetical protein
MCLNILIILTAKLCNINARMVARIVTLLQLVVLIAMLDNMNYDDVIMKVMTL